jgi:hypothetical protein
MTEWPFGIGDTRFISAISRGEQLPERNESITFEARPGDAMVACNGSGLVVGTVLEESSVLRLRHTLDAKLPYVAEVANIAAATRRIEIRVSWPARLLPASGPVRVVLPAKLRHQMRSRLAHSMAETGILETDIDLEGWLHDSFLFHGRFLVFIQNAQNAALYDLLSPSMQLHCEMHDASFFWVVNSGRLPKNPEATFQRAGLIEGEIEWLTSETEVPEAAQGALSLLDAITARSEYFSIWERYHELELQMAKDKAAALLPLAYRRLKYYEDVVRFYLEPGSDPAAWSEDAGGLSVELVLPLTPKKDKRSTDEPDETVLALGTVRRVGPDYIDVDRPDDELGLPPRAKLRVSPVGDLVRLARQQAALERLRNGPTPIRHLEMLLSTGGHDEIISHLVPGFAQYPPTMADGTTPNDRQIEAVEIALNTPDICVIQGPPGTGKTAVIRTILRRLKEQGRRHLLISSYQHAAVDNALDGLQACGVVAYRFGGNQTSDTYRSIEIDTWVQEVASAVNARQANSADTDPDYALRLQLKSVLEAAPAGCLDAIGCTDFMTNVLLEYSQIIPPSLRHQGNVLYVQLESLTAIPALKQGTTQADRLAGLLEHLPSDPHEIPATSLLGQVNAELERLSRGRPDEQSVAREYRRHYREVYRLEPQLRFGTDRPGTREQLQAHAIEARDIAIRYLRQRRESLGSAKERAYHGAEAWRADFSNWCREVVQALERELPTSRGYVPAVVQQWLYDITHRPGQITELFRKHADVWGITCQQTVASRFALYDEEFDYVVVDEAARAAPLDLLIPLVRARRIVLVGDQRQLPHALDYRLEKEFEALVEQTEHRKLLKESLFARIFEQLPAAKRVRLNYQYRMNPQIGRMVSGIFYSDDPLIDHPSTHTLVNDTELFSGSSLVWHDVTQHNSAAKLEEGQYYNRDEAEQVVNYVRKLLESRTSRSIGVITYYAQQRDLIERSLRSQVPGAQRVQVGTVDAFQGIEKDIILLSTVRSNPEKRLGFLGSLNRLNVSLSRARRLLVILGDARTVTASPYLRAAFDHCQKVEGVVSSL